MSTQPRLGRRAKPSSLATAGAFALSTTLAGVLAAQSDAVPTPPSSTDTDAGTDACAQPHFERSFEASRFQRGNLHAHTTLSDGHSSPERTILWYESHGYQFLALTDHNVLSHPGRYATLLDPGFVLIPGEEITMTGNGRPVHVNALCTHTRIPGGVFTTTSAALSQAISRVTAQGGVTIINHPNFDWALSLRDLIDARDAPLLEIASGHPYVHSDGDATHPSHEQLWDGALAAGADYMGVAVDDVHRIDASGSPLALPGKGWVEVFAERAELNTICSALARGELYSSTGVELRRITVTPLDYVVEPACPDDVVTFIGSGGRVLSRVAPHGAAAAYTPRGDAGYVRARVESTEGKFAWTPAVRVGN